MISFNYIKKFGAFGSVLGIMQNITHPYHSQTPHLLSISSKTSNFPIKSHSTTLSFQLSCSSSSSTKLEVNDQKLGPRPEYKPTWLDDFFLNSFRQKLVEEVGWESEKEGYDGLIELANGLLVGRSKEKASQAAVRILKSLFPPFLLDLYRTLITPIGGGKIAAIMVARVTAFTCQWLMGPCSVNSITLPDGSSCQSGVFVERCKYLEESKCVGVCVNTCKLPTQTFFKDEMGIPLLMEPNFKDYSCQFSFGVPFPPCENDTSINEPCLEICPNAPNQREGFINVKQCPRS
ncbi:beta-carotene isomerase D27, chloroplastic isoform X2 [Silene latifolia]|uniref:beta-carotene isomerase D27, chloroplastic isoform X2 n=1 Tax=Silene latifolia TaxID=37657 RepID=UPI003D788A78